MAVVQGDVFNEPPLITQEFSAGQFQRPKETYQSQQLQNTIPTNPTANAGTLDIIMS